MTAAELLLAWYDQVWNNANEDYIDKAMDKDVIVHGLDPTGTTHGVESFKQFYKDFRKSFSDIQVDVNILVSDTELAAGYCYVSAQHIKGTHTFFTGICVIKVKDNKLTEGWNNFDFLKMYQQLGHILVAEIEQK